MGRRHTARRPLIREDGHDQRGRAWLQVSRLGNPLFNEVIVPMGRQGPSGTACRPIDDTQFAKYVAQPELAKLLPVLYPGVFPNLAALTADRADLVAILLTGIPAGLIPGFQNFTGTTQADLLRLNMAIPPARHRTERHPRRRPRRLPQRPAGVRQRRHHRAAGRRRA